MHQAVITNLFPKPVGSEVETRCPLREAFSAMFCSSFDVKPPLSSDKTESTAASTPVSWAAVRFLLTVCFSHLLLWLPWALAAAFVTAKRTLIGDVMLTAKTDRKRWTKCTCETLGLNSQQSSCLAGIPFICNQHISLSGYWEHTEKQRTRGLQHKWFTRAGHRGVRRHVLEWAWLQDLKILFFGFFCFVLFCLLNKYNCYFILFSIW